MVHFSVQASASLAFLVSTASSLIIDVVQLPQTSYTPVLRCQPVIAANPSQGEGCPTGSPFWLWDYNSTPTVYNAQGRAETLVNLKGLDTQNKENTYLLNELGYDSKFMYGTTQYGLRAQPSDTADMVYLGGGYVRFRVKRNGVYQKIDVNNKLAVDDLLEFSGPAAPAARDTTIRLQSQSKNPAYAPVIRQLTSAITNPISTAQYPVVTLRIASLGNQEIIAPKQSWLQRGSSLLSKATNAIKSGYNTVVSGAVPFLQDLSAAVYDDAGNLINKGINAASYGIGSFLNAADKKLAQWTDDAGNYVAGLGPRIANSAENYFNNLGTRIANSSLANTAAGLVDAAGNKLSRVYDNAVGGLIAAGGYIDDQAGNKLNSAVDYVAAPLARAGQWVGEAPGRLVAGYNGLVGQLGNQLQGLRDRTANGLTNLAGRISPGVVAPGAAGGVVKDVEMIPLSGGVPVVQEQASVPAVQGVVARGLSEDLPVIDEVVSDLADDESWTDLSASQFFRFKRS
ncbi:hypothetical protein AA313_de0200465 [Arthrobotrys entomopaga]|nr:hypothetical protein AA313_de0200465 [Arthrobotrys entomopaga]